MRRKDYEDYIESLSNYISQFGQDEFDDVEDEELTERYASEYGMQYDARDELYTKLLHHYIETSEQKTRRNRKYKLSFFIIVMTVFCVLILSPIFAMFVVIFKNTTNTVAIVSMASGAISIVSAIIVLPKIIAKHLFPADEDKNMIDLVKNMQDNDSGIRNNCTDKK